MIGRLLFDMHVWLRHRMHAQQEAIPEIGEKAAKWPSLPFLHRDAAVASSILPELNIFLSLFRLKNIAVIVLRIALIR